MPVTTVPPVPTGLLIAGEWQETLDRIPVFDPGTMTLLAEVSDYSVDL